MTQHTPGPWFAHNIGLGPNGEGPFTYPLGTDPDKAAANARLIAAAPDMLAALQMHDALPAWPDREALIKAMDATRAAIAKALNTKAKEA
jgi:hypothetical protein